MKQLIVHIETSDVPLDVVEQEVDSWLADLKDGAWRERYAGDDGDLDFGWRLFDSLEAAAEWEREGFKD